MEMASAVAVALTVRVFLPVSTAEKPIFISRLSVTVTVLRAARTSMETSSASGSKPLTET